MEKIAKPCFLSLALLCLLALLPTSPRAQVAPQMVRIDGSSTVFPISDAIGRVFQKARKDQVEVTVGISGTGGGFRKFCRGETDLNDASRPILKSEMAACERDGIAFHEIPIGFDSITVVVHPDNRWVTSLTTRMLKRMWEPEAQLKITFWNQLERNWPNTPLKLFGPGIESGTFDYFTEAVLGQARASRLDFYASEDDNELVRKISGERNALGYFGLGYYIENRDRLRAIAIDGGAGPVVPSVESVRKGAYTPLSRPIFIYVNHKSASKPPVRDFIEFYLRSVLDTVTGLKYVPLPKKFYKLNLQNFKHPRLGTVFNGQAEIGITIERLFGREAKF